MTILLVDENTTFQNKLTEFLQGKGYSIVHASSGFEALERLQQYPIGIIIATWEMSDMDGIELCRTIRGLPKDSYIYLIMLAKKLPKEKKLEGFREGIDSYLTEPIDFDELEALVQVGKRIGGFNTLKAEGTGLDALPGQPESPGDIWKRSEKESKKEAQGESKKGTDNDFSQKHIASEDKKKVV
ncbi:hypothetical protein MTBBW1_750021 [Desulfamplus magnetovallimortis]|uniref:Response regulatory domain-containing protein n=1 Tax=Desulfamplus magnetovallimortis TaxID=1246637 RepID=A0A1W1HJ61_9BACT|nr:response regulator [Desulfamplus magnetovallimortis]SLM32500.1 hypothetical protein MTBBW1_750021 [Desulfamplus magnetovallimortis]